MIVPESPYSKLATFHMGNKRFYNRLRALGVIRDPKMGSMYFPPDADLKIQSEYYSPIFSDLVYRGYWPKSN